MRSLVGSIVDKAPVPFTPRRSTFSTAFGQRNNAVGQMRAMGAVGTLFSIVNRTSTAVAKAEWKLYRKAKTGKVEDRTEVTSHLALDIWNAPNPFYTRQELVESVQQHVDLTGEGWPVVARNPAMRSLPLELWFARPDRMAPVVSPTDFIVGYTYTSADGEVVPLELDEVMQIRMPNPLDPYRGMGVVQALLVDIDSTRYSAEWNRNFFLNSAEPGGIIEVEKRLSDPEFDEMVTRWREQHQGVANAHRVGIVEQGKWVNRTFTMRDMQFAELRSVSREIIREAFGMPKFMLGLDESVNRATAEASEVVFARWLTIPRLDRWKGMLNNDFLPMFGKTAAGLEFDYESPVPEDREADNAELTSKATAAKTYIEAGFTGESVAEALELPDALVWDKPAPVLPPAPGQDPAEPDARWSTLVARLTRRSYNAAEIRAQVDLDAVQADWQAALDALLDDWETLTAGQREQIAAQVRAAVNNDDPAALAAITVSSAEAAALLAGAMAALAATAAGRLVDEAAAQDVTIEAAHVSQASFAAAAGATAALVTAGYVLAAGREGLRWYGYGRDGDTTATAVTAHLRDLSTAPLRAQLGGALTWAQNTGRLATLAAAPKATWYASEQLDSNTCGPCRKIDGKRLPTLEAMQLAYGGGGYLHCEGTVRCRGTVIAVWE